MKGIYTFLPFSAGQSDQKDVNYSALKVIEMGECPITGD